MKTALWQLYNEFIKNILCDIQKFNVEKRIFEKYIPILDYSKLKKALLDVERSLFEFGENCLKFLIHISEKVFFGIKTV